MTQNTPQIPDPIAALAEVTGRLVPFDQFEMVNANGDHIEFARLSEVGKVDTQKVLNTLASQARVQAEDGSNLRSMHIVTDNGEPSGLGKTQVVALRTPLGDILIVEQKALATWVKQGTGERMPKYTVVALAKVESEDEAVELISTVRAAQAANDAVVTNGFGSLDAGSNAAEADTAPAL